jgi:hypothetical protein
MASDMLNWNVTKTATLITIVASLSAVIWTTAIAHDRLARAEARIQTLEEKMQWQNEILWEIRGDMKVIREQIAKRTS